MLTDIHGVDPTQFRANLGEQPTRDGSRKKRRKHPATVEAETRESETGEVGLQLHHDTALEHLDVQA